ncbi:hypothetical protein Poli38472_002527 [Pythium oligandrum]|uniref:BZIP domain-containing protein n=1 Tax=Pythium oligandrum TaxID=41045 RepID=A0A8K1FI97_PYTOL|nr:hypothetical protein Poli38472_002527 [Pythium oligandrum]|eukprot:TMW63586.1 hypothetical protein Poli38472_002527 [Pythium oligandrum]
MTISPLDADLFFRGHEFATSTTTSTLYAKDVTVSAQAPYTHTAHADGGQELELGFLSEFLLQDDVNHDHQHAQNSAGYYHPSGHPGMYHGGAQASSSYLPPLKIEEGYEAAMMSGMAPSPSAGSFSPHSSSSSADPADGNEPLDRKAKRRQQVAISARRHRSRKKHELLDLRKEVSSLSAQLDFLRSKHKMMRQNGAVAEWEEKAMAQRRKRRQAEQQNEELRRGLFQQNQFISTLKTVFSAAPQCTQDLNMRQLLHTYTRLGMNPRSRQRDFEALCSESKLQMAADILRRQTESIRFSTPYINTQMVETSEMFGATVISVYAFDTLDLPSIFRATCMAIRDSSNTWPEFADREGQRVVVDAVPVRNITYGKQRTIYKKETSNESEELVIEARAVSYWQITSQEAVLVWDYVDQDDLHPLQPGTDVRRDMVGACLVRRELCEDGKERIVFRSICSKLHNKPVTGASKAVLTDFSTSPSRDLSRMCGNFVFQSIRQAALAGSS